MRLLRGGAASRVWISSCQVAKRDPRAGKGENCAACKGCEPEQTSLAGETQGSSLQREQVGTKPYGLWVRIDCLLSGT